MNISYTYVFSLYIHNPALQSPLQNILSSIPNLLEARRQNRLSILRIDRGRITGFALRIVQIGTLKNYQKIIFCGTPVPYLPAFPLHDPTACALILKKVKITYICYRVSRKKNSMLLLVVRKNDQPIGVIVHSNYFECLLQRWTDEGRVAVDCEKKHKFS